MSNESVKVEPDDGILTISINRPQARNAIDLDVARRIAAAMEMLDDSAELLVGIICGTGENFCAGADLKALARGERAIVEGRGFAGLVRNPPRKPLICAVEGYALGGGFEIAMACDLIVASEGARFGLPEVKRGLLANAGGLLRLPRQMPFRMALEMALTGDPIGAQEALGLGLINRVVPDGQALEQATALARRITCNGPLATAASKRIIYESQAWLPDDWFERQALISEPVFASADAKEGPRAFSEKRRAVWLGR